MNVYFCGFVLIQFRDRAKISDDIITDDYWEKKVDNTTKIEKLLRELNLHYKVVRLRDAQNILKKNTLVIYIFIDQLNFYKEQLDYPIIFHR